MVVVVVLLLLLMMMIMMSLFVVVCDRLLFNANCPTPHLLLVLAHRWGVNRRNSKSGDVDPTHRHMRCRRECSKV